MTRKVFWEDPYLTRLETRISGVTGDDVTVDRTIFYALSGGQESDHGTIADRRVLHVRKEGTEIVYTLESGHGLEPGDSVWMSIDWERRYRLMRLHFAAEIVLELVYRHFRPITKIGAHIGEERARIDFQWDRNISTMFPLLEREASRIIADDQEVSSAFEDEENERRYWKIDEFAPVSCGGTHLRRTGEIGGLRLKRRNVGKGKERIEITL